ncbi:MULTISPECIES: MDR family MFS transporter [Cytobacillus]|uniref:Multidrug efflux MFS transporter n=1 Tax=Cytobacillus stercorigallinarum TaxID=2762240 RepID=A0ABR8QMN9_9BACI|nr:MDR family MFS transporter [Cytobacillus stercorigallinarum]MBD7936607.1 multidrug efflux MFS transporter [Cytobacillus stercorigallinarum]
MTANHQNSNKPPYGLLAILMVGAFIAFLNNTLLNIALPSIMEDLNVDTATVQWLTTGYMLVNGVLIPATAFLIRKYSVRMLFLFAMLMFTLGTFVAGFADIFSILLIGRMMQASGSAILMPVLMNVMLVSFPVEKRGSAMGLFGLILMAAPAIGPTLSGWIVENYDWRMLFHFISPIAIIVLLLGFIWLKDKKEKQAIKLDFLSLLLSSIGFGGVLYGFSSAGNDGWGATNVYLTIIVGAISLFIFIIRQNKQKEPMLNFGVFQFPMFTLSTIITMVVNMAMFSGMLLIPIYVQNIRGISPFDAGLMMLPGALVMAAMSPLTGKLFDRFGGKILAITGLTIMTISTYFFSRLEMDTGAIHIMILHTIRMFGMSMVMMPVSTNGLNQLPPRFYPHGTAMNNTLNQVSGAIGTALLITIMSNKANAAGEDLANATLRENGGGELSQEAMLQIGLQSTLEGINFAFFVSTFISVIALILVFFMKRSVPAKDPEEQTEALETEPLNETESSK